MAAILAIAAAGFGVALWAVLRDLRESRERALDEAKLEHEHWVQAAEDDPNLMVL